MRHIVPLLISLQFYHLFYNAGFYGVLRQFFVPFKILKLIRKSFDLKNPVG